jgi:hypothetical protein
MTRLDVRYPDLLAPDDGVARAVVSDLDAALTQADQKPYADTVLGKESSASVAPVTDQLLMTCSPRQHQ